MKATRPAAERRSSGSSDRMSRQLAVTLTAITSSHVFGSRWWRGVRRPRTPALPTKASSRPHRRKSASPSRSMAAKSRKSIGTKSSPPAPRAAARESRRRVPRGRPGCGRAPPHVRPTWRRRGPQRGQRRGRPRSPERPGAIRRVSTHSIDTPHVIC